MSNLRPIAPNSPSVSVSRQIFTLAGPTTVVSLMQGLAQLAETWLVGRQGTTALAGYAMVLPFLLMMFMMSSGALGGGVASAIARALGAGRRDEASSLVVHALVIAVAMGLGLFTLPLCFGGAFIFGALGGSGAVLDAAVSFAGALFAGAILVWLVNTQAAVLRGTGNHAMPARIISLGWCVQPVIAWFFMEVCGFGLPGAGWATCVVFAVSSAVMWMMIRGGAAGFVPDLRVKLSRALFWRILSVGAIASLMAAISNLTIVLVTRLVSPYGVEAVAAYGIGTRLEFLMAPLSFGIGSALITLVGTRVGAGDWAGARYVAWRGGLIAMGIGGGVGLLLAVFPRFIASLFTRDLVVMEIAATQLMIVGPTFAGLGLGLSLYFASLGAGRVRWPFAAAISRITLAVGAGMLLSGPLGLGLTGIFIGVALGLCGYGLIVAASVREGVWSDRGQGL